MNAFQMLLVLGFPPEVAAATVAPETFLPSDNSAALCALPLAA